MMFLDINVDHIPPHSGSQRVSVVSGRFLDVVALFASVIRDVVFFCVVVVGRN